MRIDNVVIAEWTHNGKVRLWERGNLSPAFYRQAYTADELRGVGIKHRAKKEFAHYSRWQEKVDKLIYEHTGIQHGDVATCSARVRPKVMTKPRIRKAAVLASSRNKTKQVSDRAETTTIIPSTGTCKNCGQIKPASEFFISKRRPGKLTVFCKQCSKAS
jgi:RNase P/RNase MRP subunit POP5